MKITVSIDVDGLDHGVQDACWVLRETARLILEKHEACQEKGRELDHTDSFGELPHYVVEFK